MPHPGPHPGRLAAGTDVPASNRLHTERGVQRIQVRAAAKGYRLVCMTLALLLLWNRYVIYAGEFINRETIRLHFLHL